MLDLLRDAAWEFVGVLVALVTIVVAWLQYHYQRERRELAFGVFFQTALLSVSDEIAKRVHVHFDGAPVENLDLVVLAFKNSGNRALTESDFQQPTVVCFGQETRLLSVEVSRQFPENLRVQARLNEGRIEVSPLLLNPGEHFTLKVLATGASTEPKADVRIVGISQPVPIRHVSDNSNRRKILQNLVMFPAMAIILGAVLFLTGDPARWYALAYLSIFVAIPILQWSIEHFSNKANRYVDGA